VAGVYIIMHAKFVINRGKFRYKVVIKSDRKLSAAYSARLLSAPSSPS